MRTSGSAITALYLLAIICTLPITGRSQNGAEKQVTIDARIMESEDRFIKELGFDVGAGIIMSTFTNPVNDNTAWVPGLQVGGSVHMLLNPFFALSSGIEFIQYGNRVTFTNGYNQFRINTLALKAGGEVNFLGTRKVTPFITAGAEVGVNLNKSQKVLQLGQVSKSRIPLGSQDNRLFAGIYGGIGATIRTNIGDLTVSTLVLGGLTELNKNAVERSVPVLIEIPVVARLFRNKEEASNRKNLIILVTPTVSPPEE